MDCFKYKIQLSERTTQSFLKKQIYKQLNSNLRAQAFEANYYYIVIICFTGGTVEAEPLIIQVEQPDDGVHVGTNNLLCIQGKVFCW